jgi:hypothetical protein
MANNEISHIQCSLTKRTDKALLVHLDDGSEHWVPSSLTIFDVLDGNLGVLEIPRWLALKKGMTS